MDSCAKDLFDQTFLTECWSLVINSYPKMIEKAPHALILIVSSYLWQIKSNIKKNPLGRNTV